MFALRHRRIAPSFSVYFPCASCCANGASHLHRAVVALLLFDAMWFAFAITAEDHFYIGRAHYRIVLGVLRGRVFVALGVSWPSSECGVLDNGAGRRVVVLFRGFIFDRYLLYRWVVFRDVSF